VVELLRLGSSRPLSVASVLVLILMSQFDVLSLPLYRMVLKLAFVCYTQLLSIAPGTSSMIAHRHENHAANPHEPTA
jgi:hypothetical protein